MRWRLLVGCVLMLLSMSLSLAMGDAKPEVLPGSGTSLEEASTKAEIVVTASVVRLQVGDPSAPGRAYYTTDIVVDKVLKGKGVAEKAKFSFELPVETHAGEIAPKEKSRYIFLFNERPRRSVSFIKMVIANDENIAAVTKLIEGAQTQKNQETQKGQ